MRKPEAGDLYLVADCDDVLVDTAPAVADFTNEYGLSPRLIDAADVHYDLPRLWNLPREQTTEYWMMFRLDRMPYLPPVLGAQEALRHLATEGVTVDILTGRHQADKLITVRSAARLFGEAIRDVHIQRVDWLNDPLAPTRTKGLQLAELTPDAYVEDLAHHCNSGVEASVPNVYMLDRPHNRHVIELHPGVQRMNWDQVGEELLAELERRRAA